MKQYLANGMIALALLASTCCKMINRASPDQVALINIGVIQRAETEFHSTRGRYGTLAELGPSGARLISAELASGRNAPYKFDLTITQGGYVLRARPVHPNECTRSFYSDESRIVHQSLTADEANPNSLRLYSPENP